MTAIELRRILGSVPDETIILFDEGEGSFLEAAVIGVGICDPESSDVDGLLIELWDYKDGKDVPNNPPDASFPILAIGKEKTEPGEGLPVYERACEF